MVDKLVSAQWVAEHGTDAGVRLVEVDRDADLPGYGAGHIPGAVGWSWASRLREPSRRDVIAPGELEALLGASGITNDTHVVLYGGHSNWFAAYALWLLELYGHAHLSLLDGGRAKWIADGRPLTLALPAIARVAYVASPANPALRATRGDVMRALDDVAMQLIDVRSPEEFSGELIAPPGATNIPWARAIQEDGTFGPREELRALYVAAGLREGTGTIVYCRVGERASHTWFTLRHVLGCADVRSYDGSWGEYASQAAAPVER